MINKIYHKPNRAMALTAMLLLNACSPKVTSNNSTKGTVKVMTYNIHHANPPSRQRDGLIDVDAVAAAIKKQNPDLVGLQELDKNTKRSGNIDEAALIAEKNGMYFCFFKSIDYDGGDYGIAVLSRFPIKSNTKIELPQVTKGEPRVLGYITVKVPGVGEVILADTHLDARTGDNRVVQIKRIADEFAGKKVPVILTGDMNSLPTEQTIITLDQNFKRSCVDGCPFTIPEIKPNRTIDYIATKNVNWAVKDHQVIDEEYASDHRPVMATFQVK